MKVTDQGNNRREQESAASGRTGRSWWCRAGSVAVMALALFLLADRAAMAAVVSGYVTGTRGMTVGILRGSTTVATTQTAANGFYYINFSATPVTTYSVYATATDQFAVTPPRHEFTTSASPHSDAFRFDFRAFFDMTVNTETQGGTPEGVLNLIGYPATVSLVGENALRGPSGVNLGPSLNFASTNGSFHPDLPANFFRMHAVRTFTVSQSGNYTFHLRSDDGARLYLNPVGQSPVLRINANGVHSAETHSSTAISLTAGTTYRIEVQYFEWTGDAELSLRWSGPGFVDALFNPPGGNFIADFFLISNRRPTLDHPVTGFDGIFKGERISPTLEFDRSGAFYPGLPSDAFGVEATATYVGEIDGKVIFTLTSDDGAELMVTDASGRIIDPILNNDGVHGAQSKVLAMVISKGAQYKLWIRYFDDRDRAVLKLERQLVDRDNRIVSGQEIYRPESQFTLRFYDLQNLGTVTFPVPGSFFRRFHLDELTDGRRYVDLGSSRLTLSQPGVEFNPPEFVGLRHGGVYQFKLKSSPPQISDIPDTVIVEDETVDISFTVSDKQTPDNLHVFVFDSDRPEVARVEDMEILGSGGNRTLRIRPRPNATGTTRIVVFVSDGTASVGDAFNLTVMPVNDPPVAGPKYALRFDGQDDLLTVENLPLSNRSFSVEAWLKRENTGSWDVFAAQGRNSNREGLHIGFRNTDHFTFGFWGDDLDTPDPFTDNGWHHWVVTYNATNRQREIYLDGIRVADDVASGDFSSSLTTLIIGSDTPQQTIANPHFKGCMDEVRVWSVVLTTNDILARKNIQLTGREPNLVAYFRMDENTGLAATDSSGGGRHAEFSSWTGPVWVPREKEPADFGVWIVPEDSPGTPIYLSAYDPDSMVAHSNFTYTITFDPGQGSFFPTSGPLLSPDSNPVIYTPPPDFRGEVTFRYTVSDGASSDYYDVTLMVRDENDPPVISVIPDQVMLENTTLVLNFTVTDADGDQVNLGRGTSDQALLPASGIVLGGEGENRTLTITPRPDEAGTVEVTLQASDGQVTTVETFLVRIEAVPAYKIIDISSDTRGNLPQNLTVTYGAAINDAGVVLANAVDKVGGQIWRAFLFNGLESGGGHTLIPTLGGSAARGFALNNSHEVVGSSLDSGHVEMAFRMLASTDVLSLGALPGGLSSVAAAINDGGWIAGHATNSSGQVRAVVWPAGGSLTDIGTLSGYDAGSRAYGINFSNHVVGVSYNADGTGQAFLWSNGSMTPLGFLPGGEHSEARAINRFGIVVGSASPSGSPGATRPVMWENGVITELGVLPGASRAEAVGLNNFGQVVGMAVVDGESRATLYTAGRLYDLNDLIPEDQSNWRLNHAVGINSRGDIVGTASYNGVPRAFLAIPAQVIGKRVVRPVGAVAGELPRIELLESQPGDTPENSFHFSPASGKLYAIRPVTARLKWPTTDDLGNLTAEPVTEISVSVWPRDPQRHIAGAPVETQPAVPSFVHAFQSMLYSTISGAVVDSGTKVFTANSPGYSVLYYLETGGEPANPQAHPPYFEVARTYRWNDPAILTPDVDQVPWDIGTPVTSPFHKDHPGRNGWVLFEKAYYDGVGPERAYDRTTRTGPILPVNRDSSILEDDLVVVWYQTNRINVSWPVQPTRYSPRWPTDPDVIVIASTIGSGVLPPEIFGTTHRVYNQPDPNLPGFNPNEEHAMLAPASDGSGTAIFALRNDLNQIVNYSEPYALLKYIEPASGEWRIKPYYVVATTPEYPFRYEGLAGREIAPPYPLSILNLMEESHGVSGPYWEDYNGKLYARAAGTGMDLTAQVVARWWYPLQPSFFYDLDKDGERDVPTGSAIGLLDRRYPSGPHVPVDVSYVIRWPDAPVLQIGETLVNSKRGLPAIRNFASAEIIFDSANPEGNLSGPDLLNSSARLFDPLGERTIKIPELTGIGLSVNPAAFTLPPEIRTSTVNGKVYFDDLPYDIAQRLSYDPLNRWLTFRGVIDDSVVGEPLLLLNVMSVRERNRIQDLDGINNNTDWDKVVEALFDLTRNPNGVDLDPGDGQPDKAVRVGLTTVNGEVVLERLPETKALSAAIGTAPPAEYHAGNALSLSPSGDYMAGGNAVELAGQSFAFEFWLYRRDTGREQYVVSHGGTAEFGGLKIGFQTDNRFVFSFNETGANTPLVSSTAYPDLEEWHHWACTFNAVTGQRAIYRDGVAIASDIAAATYEGSGAFTVGRGHSGHEFHGLLDDLRVWNQPRTGFRVALDYRKRLLGTEEGLLRYFRFDEETDPIAIDDAVGVHGTLVNGAGRVESTAPTGISPRYITIAENNDRDLGLIVNLHVIRVDDGPFVGDLKMIAPANVFDEKLPIRHSSDFGAEPEKVVFEWYYKPDAPDVDPTELPLVDPVSGQVTDPRGWIQYTVPDPDDDSEPGRGANYITIGDGGETSLLTLGDNWFIVRYKGYEVNGVTPWSDWAGDPAAGGTPRAALAEGWVKRVIRGLNPFDARVTDFHSSAVNTYSSMLIQAGERYEGDIAFNPSADNLNSIGLIEAYETVLRRGRKLSIDGIPAVDFAPANNALLLAASRIADLYMLLGNEAYADAMDPTIGTVAEAGTAGSSLFAFQNQLDSVLEEELVLLRGRDDSAAGVGAPPVYNRLFWNFTLGEGEVAYQQNYNISDQNADGFINEFDARILYPQGHGDAWGHYLTAIKTYYELLRHPNYTWTPRAESVLVAGAAVQVDFLDERKFANAAAAKAEAGRAIVDLTYRLSYVEDPNGQWQGYQDVDPDRAWGVTEWARRAGQGAYFDWLVGNAILPPVDPNPDHVGIQKIDRQTVAELRSIPSQFKAIQDILDQADIGLNPLGLAKGVVPFDINPALIAGGYGFDGASHFVQIQERALKLLNSATKIFQEASKNTQRLRQNQDSIVEFTGNVRATERELNNRLIEIFGYPYPGDIGPGRTYPSGYSGPDLYHYMYVNATEITGENAPPADSFKAFFRPVETEPGRYQFYLTGDPTGLADLDTVDTSILEVEYPLSATDFGFVAPASWGQRRAPGQVQLALSDLVQAEARLKKSLQDYDGLIADIRAAIELLEEQYDLKDDLVRIQEAKLGTITSLSGLLIGAKATQVMANRVAKVTAKHFDAIVEGVPKVVGALAADTMSTIRQAGKHKGAIVTGLLYILADAAEIAQTTFEEAKNITELVTDLEVLKEQQDFEVFQKLQALEQLVRNEAAMRLEVYTQAEVVQQTAGRYLAALAEGERVLDQLVRFRRAAAASVTEHRYRDMTFRIFRNDALAKYRSAFDLAARYVYLAATAYDYELNFLGGDTRSGQKFLTDIVRQRSLGLIVDGQPLAGQPGLADPLARLSQNFEVLKGQFGLNNPVNETAQFSLRREAFRISDDSDDSWRRLLKASVVDDLWQVPDFRRYCRPFAPESAGRQPGLVLRFPTTVTFGLNFFGWPLGGGDSSYDPSLFSTKIYAAGVWFQDYDSAGLSSTPRVYLFPTGMDILRAPTGNDLATREWRVVDQALPEPLPIGGTDLRNPNYHPWSDALNGSFAEIRRFAGLRAYHDPGGFEFSETTLNSRLVGRSVWNTEWVLIIPGGTLEFDARRGLDVFVNTVSDIKISLLTYSYAGN